MKAFLHFTKQSLLSLSLMLGSLEVYAAPPIKRAATKIPAKPDLPVAPTAKSRNTGVNFCEAGAEKMLQNLNDKNKNKMDSIEELRGKIKDLELHNTAVSQVTALKDLYEKSLRQISQRDAQIASSKELEMATHLDSMKSVIRNGLTLNALSLLLKEENLSSTEATTMSSLCKNPDNKDQVICDKSYFGNRLTNPSGENHKLDETLKNFQVLYKSASNKDVQNSIKTDVAKIINEIPIEISPNAILSIIDSKSPETGKILYTGFSREKVLRCLSEKNKAISLEACRGLIDDQKSRDALFSAVSKESKDLKLTLSQNFSEVLDSMAKDRKDQLGKMLEEYSLGKKATTQVIDPKTEEFKKAASKIIKDAQSIASKMDLSTLRTAADEKVESTRRRSTESSGTSVVQATKVDEEDKGLANLFYASPMLDGAGLEEVREKRENAMSAAKAKARDLQNTCDFETHSGNGDEPARIKKCKNLLGEIQEKVRYIQRDHVAKISELQGEINKIKNDPEFNNIEKLKKYVTEKYLRSCNKGTGKMRHRNQGLSLDMNVEGCQYNTELSLSKIEGLGSDVAAIFTNTKFALEIKGDTPESDQNFSTIELAAITESCAGLPTEMKRDFYNVCKEVKSDNELVDKKAKDAQKLIDLNRDNYVEYDRTSPSGYRVIRKTPTSTFIANGVLPAIPNLLGMWLGNYQTNANINMLTDQAMFQKQMLHNVSVYDHNPWMYGAPYFFNPFLSNFTTSGVGVSATSSGKGSGYKF